MTDDKLIDEFLASHSSMVLEFVSFHKRALTYKGRTKFRNEPVEVTLFIWGDILDGSFERKESFFSLYGDTETHLKINGKGFNLERLNL
jgi:hypothetical protein